MTQKKHRPAKHDFQKHLVDFRARCRAMGLKITPQRTAVYKALLETEKHPSAEMVYRRVRRTFPSISLDIVDLHFEPFDRIDVPKCIRDRFTVLRKTVYFEGLCERCSKKTS
jgi:Fur family peroxide stress response transcriptional regulator